MRLQVDGLGQLRRARCCPTLTQPLISRQKGESKGTSLSTAIMPQQGPCTRPSAAGTKNSLNMKGLKGVQKTVIRGLKPGWRCSCCCAENICYANRMLAAVRSQLHSGGATLPQAFHNLLVVLSQAVATATVGDTLRGFRWRLWPCAVPRVSHEQ